MKENLTIKQPLFYLHQLESKRTESSHWQHNKWPW
jgi:hypothetical protein